MKRKQKNLCIAGSLLAAFVLWTLAVRTIDVQPIGPHESAVGFATLNRFIHDRTGVHMILYTITDWLGLVPFFFITGFAVLGFSQWMQRKNLLKVDSDILILGIFYLVVLAMYLFFEECIINYRPVLIDGFLEASYPSSTTMLVMCVMPTSMMQLNFRIKNTQIRKIILAVMLSFSALMVIARLVSGVHWFSDIIGGLLLSAALVMMYHALIQTRENPGL